LSQNGVVASDNPLASAVGAEVLRKGGSAADAGVATLLTLGVVNPFASGLGGGGFCVHRSASDGEAVALDFRETAPMAASRDMYIVDGKADGSLSRTGGLAVATPSEALGLGVLHERFGKLPWRDVVHPAWEIAFHGFYVGELLPKRLRSRTKDLTARRDFVDAFASSGDWVTAYSWLTRKDLAKTLEKIRDEGPGVMRKGPIVDAIIEAVKATGGKLAQKDFDKYEVKERKPIEGTYRGHTIFSMPPPSSGGIVLVLALNILEAFDLGGMGKTAASVHLVVEALKHAFADRARWMGDADFVKVPVAKLTSRAYADARRALIDPKATKDADVYGTTKQLEDDDGTTHISVLDAEGNMLACTSTVNTSFGSKVYVPGWGIVLNNEMDDFSAQPGVPNAYGLIGSEANAIAPRKRTLSSMTPTLVVKADEPFMIAGGSGGPTIITGTLLALLNVIDFGATPEQAVTMSRFHHQWKPEKLFMEPGGIPEDEMKPFGHDIRSGPAYNSVQIIVRDDASGAYVGVSDPRKNGRPAAPRSR